MGNNLQASAPTLDEINANKRTIDDVAVEINGRGYDNFRSDFGLEEEGNAALSLAAGCVTLGFLFIFLAIGLGAALHDTKGYIDRPKRQTKFVNKDETWFIPDNIDDGGRVFITATGAGGGGCHGGMAIAGGGGNSGVSIVNYPLILDRHYKCIFTMGNGGDYNMEGSSTLIYCFDKDGIKQVDLRLEGGKSGCDNSGIHRGSNIYPWVHELFGARPSIPTVAEDNPYGGVGGLGNNGGAGSMFGTGGMSENHTPDGEVHYAAAGAGGHGGTSNFGLPGKGGDGKIYIEYHTR